MMHWIKIIICSGLASALSASEPIEWNEIDAVLKEPQTLIAHDGRTFQGRASHFENGSLTFSQTEGRSTISFQFTTQEIKRLQFPGSDYFARAEELYTANAFAEAIALLEKLYEQRVRYFALLPQSELQPFVTLAGLQLQYGSAYSAIGVARNLQPFIENSQPAEQLEDFILLAHYKLPLREKTKQLAEDWITTRPRYARSALGWFIQAELSYEAEQFEHSRLTALEPIVFSSQLATPYLEHCYALAIASQIRLEAYSQARALHREMQSRDLAWPTSLSEKLGLTPDDLSRDDKSLKSLFFNESS